MPDHDPLPSIKTLWGSATPPSGALPGEVPPIPIPDHTLIRRIGKGSYGEVWLARNVLGVYRAVKIIHRGSFDDDRPFEREFAGMQRFEPVSRSHESQLNILQVGRAPDCFYYVMELADDMGGAYASGGTSYTSPQTSPRTPTDSKMGTRVTRPSGTRPSDSRGDSLNPDTYTPRNLRSELLLRGRLPVDECLRLGLALTTALENLHRHGLVHRDIKPSNIVFVNGIPKLADIGLVALAESTMSFVGTEGYLPPEGPGTVQADLFSLGKVLYEISTGRDRQQFPELPTGITELPDRAALAEFNEVLLRACAPDVKQRYETAAEMHADLALLQSGKSVARMRAVERRLKFVARAGAAVTGIALLAGSAFLYQQVQTREARRLAGENKALAEAKTQLADESRQRLVRQRVANGVRHMNEGDLSQALLWFAEALPLVESDPEQARVHRIRLGAALDQIPQLMHVLPHEERVNRCWFSPDGKSLLTFAVTTARVWDVATGQPLSPPLSPGSPIRFGGFSPDGRRVLTGDAHGVLRLWDSAKDWRGSILGSNIVFCVWHPDGKSILSCSSNQPAVLIDAANGVVQREFPNDGAVSICGAISPDGWLLALADSKQQVCLWDTSTGQRYGSPLPIGRPVTFGIFGPSLFWRVPIQFDRQGRRLLVVTGNQQDARVEVWDVAEQRRVFGPTKGGSGIIGGVALDSDGSRLVLVNEHDHVAGQKGAIEVWDVETGRLLRTLSPHISGNGAMFLPEINAIAASSWDDFAQLWNPNTGERLTPPLTHSAYVLDMALSPDGTLFATASDDAVVKLWRLGPKPQQRLLNPPHGNHPAAILSADASPDERLIATGSCDGVVRIWDTATSRLVRELTDPNTNAIEQVKWSHDGNRILGVPGDLEGHSAREPRALLWDAHSGRLVASFAVDARNLEGTRSRSTAAISQDGSRIATIQADRTARVWNASDGSPLSSELKHDDWLEFVGFSPDGQRVVTGCFDKAAHVWEVSSGREVLPPLRPLDARRDVHLAVYSPDSRKILTVGGDQCGRIWDATSGELLTTFKHAGDLFLAAWRPDGNRVITGGLSPDIRTWDALTGQTVLPPMSHELGLTSLRYSPDGKLVASVSSDHTARVWDASTGEPLIPPVDRDLPATVALLLDNGRRLFSAGEDGTGRFVNLAPTPLPTEDLRAYARAVSSRDIDSFEALHKLSKEQVVEALRSVRVHRPEFFSGPKP